MTTIGIIDADAQSRAFVKSTLDGQDEFKSEIVFELSTCKGQLDQVKLNKPDLIVLDVQCESPRVIRRIKEAVPETKVLVYTQISMLDVIMESFFHGAASYLSKNATMESLIYSILAAKNGGAVMCPDIASQFFEQFNQNSYIEKILSYRELQIARSIASGMTYQRVAEIHNLSLDTVRSYVKRVYRKLDINGRGELTVKMRWSLQEI